ncbi:UPF0728 protein-like [Tubulanus polymorphus]|uniref:UPF0728 protein-like n=1 Tax=Tubulanus polymorphus TaxID=672921 RepID=UPI003DA35AF6
MPANANVFIHYGPYDSCGVVDHREHRLQGMKYVLENKGHKVDFVQINDRNIIEIWVNGERIFTDDIRQLDFGGDGHLDPKCSDALEAVNQAF